MLGIEGYGSDSDNGSDNEVATPQPPPKPTSSLTTKPAKKSTFSLPAPSSGSGLSLPAPKKRAPKKITIGLPELSKDDELEDDRPPAKKARLEPAGRSGLLSMLPAPKNKAPVQAAAERMLGGGRGPGLVFHTASSVRKATVEEVEEEGSSIQHAAPAGDALLEEEKPEEEKKPQFVGFLPPHLRKGKANVSTEERSNLVRAAPPPKVAPAPAPAVDFFGLGMLHDCAILLAYRTTTTFNPIPLPLYTRALQTPPPNLLLSPHRLRLQTARTNPSGSLPRLLPTPLRHLGRPRPAYFKKYYDRWTKEYNDHVRALEKGIEKGFEGMEREGAQEVDAAKEMERAKVEVMEREEKKALTVGAGAGAAAPKMNIKGAALSGRARGRHQLSTLLSEAYSNREELEEKIAQGRKNRKEAGNKYGF
ncbi:hypothetical protein EUX98_g283 [Antrodiella citrinella]|uniref:Mitotic checkpoint regulator, MAD2B-interacting-domain-containing protein n=1 Tax=Antrodiella citrinella TaxID=2447956 RepID=A0A4S4N7M2_9APHY|nr:hypothetical protein EUX98_g283 [Antrodiella citrinella]